MDEVAIQLKSFSETLEGVREWQLAFWSNGVGKVPGFFQTRMKEDDKRREEEDERHAQVKEDLKEQNEKLAPVVSYIEEQRILREHRKKRWEFWRPILWKVGGSVAGAFVALVIWAAPKVTHISIVLWEDYLKYHPEVTEQLKSVDKQPSPGIQLPQAQPVQPSEPAQTPAPHHRRPMRQVSNMPSDFNPSLGVSRP